MGSLVVEWFGCCETKPGGVVYLVPSMGYVKVLRACSFLTLEFGEGASLEGSFLSKVICERTLRWGRRGGKRVIGSAHEGVIVVINGILS